MPGKVVTFGEVMLRLTTPGHQRFVQARSFDISFGGAEANVAVSLANFGMQAEYVTRLPANELGDACVNSLRQVGVGTGSILRGGDRMGVYFLESGIAQRGSTVLYDRAGSSIATLQPGELDWHKVLAGATWFHWTGITPAISANLAEVLAEGCRTARDLGITISCDLNYRAKLWKWGRPAGEVMAELAPYCDLIIANEEDADTVFGIRAPETDVTAGEVEAARYRTVCEALGERFPNLTFVAVTLRGSKSASHNSWSGVLWHRSGQFLQGPTYDILPIEDRVGGGDAFGGGLIFGLLSFGEDYLKALRFAVAASCLKHTLPGDYNMVTRAEVERLMRGDASGRVKR